MIERPYKQLEALTRLSQAICNYHHPDDLFNAIVAELRLVIAFDLIVIWRLNDEGETVFISSGADSAPVPVNPKVDPSSLTAPRWVYDRQEPLVMPYLSEDPRFRDQLLFLRQSGIQSLCALPLTTVHRRVGVIGLASKLADAYCPEELEFLGLVGSLVAVTLDAGLSFQESRAAEAELRERNERLQLLLEINNTLVSNLEYRDLLHAILTNLRVLMKCDGVGVALHDTARDRLRIAVVQFPGGRTEFSEDDLLEEDSPAAAAFRSGQTVCAGAGTGQPVDSIARAHGLQAVCILPLASRHRKLGLLTLVRTDPVPFNDRDISFLTMIGGQIAIALENAAAYREIAELKDRLTVEKVYLEDEIRTELNFEEIIGRSGALRKVLHKLSVVAPTDSTVLIYGETGTGKELIARAIHNLSARAKGQFVKLNCAAIPTGLLESEMFGHERGAFTGAVTQRIGRFELANHGTVFLDEVGEIALDLQPKLLRVLQEREFERLGSTRTLRTDARLIAATNRDLGAMAAQQTFRSDLFYRLNVFPLYIPALRERPEDIPLLVRHFVQQYARRMNRVIDTIPSETMTALMRYHWPGNIRELQNVIERAVILSQGPVLNVTLSDLPVPSGADRPNELKTLEEMERRHILDVLDATRWVIAGNKGAAAILGLKRTTLQARMEKLGIRRARIAE
jgi:formate hydrogenlyase transcriptional activator